MIYETKMIKVCLSKWQCYLPKLTVNLLVLAILSLGSSISLKQAIAQVPNNESNRKQAANNDTVSTTLEPKILAEINRVRTSPKNYAQWLETQRKYYDGIWLRLPGERAVRTNKGRKALEEAIAFLKEQAPLPPLQTSPRAAATASSELKNFATAQNIQYFSYGRKTATGIVMGLVVDDLFPDRRRRNSLLSPDAENTGVVCKSDPRYARVCAIAYSDVAAKTDVTEIEPETAKPEKNAIANVPETITTPETSETTASSEIKKPEIATTISEDTDTGVETLPVPPQPQVPPILSESSAEQPKETAAEDLEADLQDLENIEVPQADDGSELEAEVSKSEPEEISEEEIEVAEEVESQREEVLEDQPNTTADEAEAESEIAEIIEESEEIATNSSRDRLLEKVERGALEKGDRIISDDGSLYDFYPLSGKAGDTFSIYLESDQFDAFVALVDSKGNTIKENDDISEEDSNSRIRVTLPEDGTYNIIVNTYDEQGTGKYVLTVSR